MPHKYQFERVLMKDSVCPSINNVNIGVDIRILAGSIRETLYYGEMI